MFIISSPYVQIVKRAWANRPADRPSMMEIVQVFRNAISAYVRQNPPRPPSSMQRNPGKRNLAWKPSRSVNASDVSVYSFFCFSSQGQHHGEHRETRVEFIPKVAFSLSCSLIALFILFSRHSRRSNATHAERAPQTLSSSRGGVSPPPIVSLQYQGSSESDSSADIDTNGNQQAPFGNSLPSTGNPGFDLTSSPECSSLSPLDPPLNRAPPIRLSQARSSPALNAQIRSPSMVLLFLLFLLFLSFLSFLRYLTLLPRSHSPTKSHLEDSGRKSSETCFLVYCGYVLKFCPSDAVLGRAEFFIIADFSSSACVSSSTDSIVLRSDCRRSSRLVVPSR